MNFLYLGIDLLFLIPVTLAGWKLSPAERRRAAKVTGALLALTLVFDNLIIAAGIVAYDPSRISGLMLGLAPIEDFAYAIAAGVLMPYIWKKGSTE